MSDNLFEGTPSQTPVTNPEDATGTLLASIKNERGEQKYRTVEEALKGLAHSQAYIPEIKNELNTVKSQLETIKSQAEKTAELERVVAELTQRNKEPVKPTEPAFTEESLANLVTNQISSLRKAEQAEQNRTQVRSVLVSKLGEEKAAEYFQQKADELGVSVQQLTSIASDSPKAALAMLGVSGDGANKQPKYSPSPASIRTEGAPKRTDSLIGNREAFKLPTGHTDKDVMEMKNRSDQLLEELNENGISIDDLTDPSVYFKIFK